MRVHERLSPNFDSRQGAEISILLLHYTGMASAEAALARLTDIAAKVSAHYVIEEDGRVWQLVAEEDRAWHAGVGHWRGNGDVNACSLGIEIVNPGHERGYRDFPAAQMQAVATLCEQILTRHPGIEQRDVVGHSDVAPDRKEDPGERFDWAWLAARGIGLWPESAPGDEARLRETLAAWGLPEESREGDAHRGVAVLQHGLAEYGYRIGVSGLFDRQTTQVVRAFQRHFRQEKVDGVWDARCQTLLERLILMNF